MKLWYIFSKVSDKKVLHNLCIFAIIQAFKSKTSRWGLFDMNTKAFYVLGAEFVIY